MAKEQYVSKAEFSRVVGKSRAWINRLIKDGKLKTNADGQVALNSGLKYFDSVEISKTERRTQQTLPEDDSDDLPITGGSLSKRTKINDAFNQARMAEKTYQAKLKELEYKLRKGELVEVEKVKEDAQAVAAALRSRLMSVPVRIAGLCEGRSSREIEEILENALNDVLYEFKKSDFI